MASLAQSGKRLCASLPLAASATISTGRRGAHKAAAFRPNDASQSTGSPCAVHTLGARPPVTLYCHGLGASYDEPLAVALQRHVARSGHRFTRFQYSRWAEVGSTHWSVDRWKRDIVSRVDEAHSEFGDASVNLVAASAGAQAALRAAIARPSAMRSLVLIAPGVGLTLDMAYMERVLPGSVAKLDAGQSVLHPGLKGGQRALVRKRELIEYGAHCPVNSMDVIPIDCPVGIIHGLDDDLVPCANSEALARKVRSAQVQLVLVKGQGHIFMQPSNALIDLINHFIIPSTKQ